MQGQGGGDKLVLSVALMVSLSNQEGGHEGRGPSFDRLRMKLGGRCGPVAEGEKVSVAHPSSGASRHLLPQGEKAKRESPPS